MIARVTEGAMARNDLPGLKPSRRSRLCNQWRDRCGGIRERRLRAHRHIAREQHAVDEHHRIAMRVIRAHRVDLRSQPAEIEQVFIVEHDVGAAMGRGIEEQFQR